MDGFKLCWKESVHKDLRRLPPGIIPKIIKKAESLPANPIPIDSKEKEILVYRVRHRKDAYQV